MYNILIKKYIEKMTIYDIKTYCEKNNIEIKDSEIQIIYIYIKKYWQILLNGNPAFVFQSIRPNLSLKTYDKVLELYNEYKNKINF